MDIKIDLDTFLCKLQETSVHQLKDACILPCCGETVCQKCVVNTMVNRQNPELFTCVFCAKLNRVDSLIENKIINSIINKSWFKNCELKQNQNVISGLVDEILGLEIFGGIFFFLI